MIICTLWMKTLLFGGVKLFTFDSFSKEVFGNLSYFCISREHTWQNCESKEGMSPCKSTCISCLEIILKVNFSYDIIENCHDEKVNIAMSKNT